MRASKAFLTQVEIVAGFALVAYALDRINATVVAPDACVDDRVLIDRRLRDLNKSVVVMCGHTAVLTQVEIVAGFALVAYALDRLHATVVANDVVVEDRITRPSMVFGHGPCKTIWNWSTRIPQRFYFIKKDRCRWTVANPPIHDIADNRSLAFIRHSTCIVVACM